MTCHVKGNPIKIVNFSEEIGKTRRPQDDILKVQKKENCQLRIFNSAKLFFKNEGKKGISR